MKPTPKNERPLTAKILAVLAIVTTLTSVLVLTTSADWVGGDTTGRNLTTPMFPYAILQDGQIGDEPYNVSLAPDVLPVSGNIGINDLDGYSVENADGLTIFFRENADYTNVSGYTTANGTTPRGYLALVPTYSVASPVAMDGYTQYVTSNVLTISQTTIFRDGETPAFSMGSIADVGNPTARYRCSASFVDVYGTLTSVSLTGNVDHHFVQDDGLYAYDIGTILTHVLETDHDVDWDYPVALDNLTITTTSTAFNKYDIVNQTYAIPYLYAGTANPIYPSMNAYDLIPRITERLDIETFGERIYTAVDNVLSVELYPDITIGMVFSIVMGIVLLVVFVKLFAGG